jgi:hypothetical protein
MVRTPPVTPSKKNAYDELASKETKRLSESLNSKEKNKKTAISQTPAAAIDKRPRRGKGDQEKISKWLVVYDVIERLAFGVSQTSKSFFPVSTQSKYTGDIGAEPLEERMKKQKDDKVNIYFEKQKIFRECIVYANCKTNFHFYLMFLFLQT